ncbi:MAG: ATP-binding cassette domain-containing protein, partial [Chloroflexota bacterium]
GLRTVTDGRIAIEGEDFTNSSPTRVQQYGVSYVPEERMIDGVVKNFTVAENLVLQEHGRSPFSRGGFLNFRRITQETKRAITDYEIKTPSHDTPIKNLSGGNIQKLVLARELRREPRLLVAAQPTRGVDIGASEYIHQRLLEERDRGTAVLLISEDLDEIRALSDRVMVMYEGKVMGIVENDKTTVEEIGLMMAGTRQEDLATT